MKLSPVPQRGNLGEAALVWATDKNGCYILCPLYDSHGRRLDWNEEIKQPERHIRIRGAKEALSLLRTGLFATWMRPQNGGVRNIVNPDRLSVKKSTGALVP